MAENDKPPFEFLAGLQRGGSIRVRDNSELYKILESSETEVPGRLKGRENRHRERYCLQSYLRMRQSENSLLFPLAVSAREAPDFLIETPKGTTGVEHTDAGHPAIYGESFRNDRGYLNDEEVGYWFYDIKCAIFTKVIKLQDYQDFDSYDLIIYDQTGFILDSDQLKKGISKVSTFYTKLTTSLAFRLVFDEIWLVGSPDEAIRMINAQ